jgi:hypothetical protein
LEDLSPFKIESDPLMMRSEAQKAENWMPGV